MDEPLQLPGGRRVPADLLTFRASTSGGPGGQHANRSNTRVELSVRVDDLPLSVHERSLVHARLGGRINSEGVLTVASGEQRSQLQNRRVAQQRMQELLAEALRRQVPRRPTRMSRSVRERLREAKRRRSARKRDRAWRPDRD